MRRLSRHLREHGAARLETSGGFTLVEMLVAMFMLLIVSSIATSVFIGIQKTLRKQIGYVDAETSSRVVFEDLDKQVRYANAVTAPGTDVSGNQYVEWETGDTGAVQTCHQWRVTVAGLVQQRSWTVTSPNAVVASPAAPLWSTVTGGALVAGQAPVFTSPVPVVPGSGSVPLSQQLGVLLVVQTGSPAGRASTNTVFTAANSTYTRDASNMPQASVVCTQVARTP